MMRYAAILLALVSGSASAHGVYTGLTSPTGMDCCEGRDCHPLTVGHWRYENQELYIYFFDKWMKVSEENITRESPDGNIHLCYTPLQPDDIRHKMTVPTLRCIIAPPFGT
jgi:hypothetical protein